MGLSKNVMNLKFMQRTLGQSDPKEEKKKLNDTSEWSLPNRGAIRNSLKPAVLIKYVGYGSIAMVEAPKQEEQKGVNVKDEKKKPAEEEAQDFLKKIRKKRKKEELEEKKKKLKKKKDPRKVDKS